MEPSRGAVLRFALILGLAPLVACSASRVTTNTPRTATQQLLVTEAADRALGRLPWPPVAGQSVFVETVSTGSPEDDAYLEAAAEFRLAESGGFITEDRKEADCVATLIAGALGTEQSESSIGIPSMQSLFLPAPFPEINFYKVARQEGFAKTELVLREAETGGLLYHGGPTRGRAYSAEHTVLFLSFRSSDTTRDAPVGEVPEPSGIRLGRAGIPVPEVPLLLPGE